MNSCMTGHCAVQHCTAEHTLKSDSTSLQETKLHGESGWDQHAATVTSIREGGVGEEQDISLQDKGVHQDTI